MKKNLLFSLIVSLLLSGCTYSNKGPIAAPTASVRPVTTEHMLHHSISVKDIVGIRESARHIGVFKIVTEKEVNAALRKNLQSQGLAAVSQETARSVSYTHLTLPTTPYV